MAHKYFAQEVVKGKMITWTRSWEQFTVKGSKTPIAKGSASYLGLVEKGRFELNRIVAEVEIDGVKFAITRD